MPFEHGRAVTCISEIGRKDLGPARSGPYMCDGLIDPSGMVAGSGPGGARTIFMALHHCPGGRTGLATLRLTPVSAIISDLPASVIDHCWTNPQEQGNLRERWDVLVLMGSARVLPSCPECYKE